MTMSTEADQFVRHFENAIEGLEPDSLNPETVIADVPQLDSLGLLCLLAMIDCEYEVQVRGVELRSCRTLGDIYQLVAAKKQAAAT